MTAVAAKHKFTYRSRAKFWVHLVLGPRHHSA